RAEFELDGLARYRRSALAQAAAAGHADPRAFDGAGKPPVAEPTANGADQVPLRGHRRGGHVPDDYGDNGDARPPRVRGAPLKLFEATQVGDVFDYGRYTFTAEAIKAFAVRYDPQAFHVDEVAGERSHFGALVASGWHTALAWMRLMVDYRRRMDE